MSNTWAVFYPIMTYNLASSHCKAHSITAGAAPLFMGKGVEFHVMK